MDDQFDPTATRILDAARARLLADDYVGLPTRGVADAAHVPLSRIRYHFGGTQGLAARDGRTPRSWEGSRADPGLEDG